MVLYGRLAEDAAKVKAIAEANTAELKKLEAYIHERNKPTHRSD